MSVSLREVDENNFWQCINLKVADEQTNFVASNLYSIAESKIRPHYEPQAVYDGEELVGFTMYGRDPKTGKHWIVRVMIGEQFQGRGYGKALVRALIERIGGLPEANEIYLSLVPGNDGAEALYRNAGFERTGEYNEYGELIMRLTINNNAKRQSSI